MWAKSIRVEKSEYSLKEEKRRNEEMESTA
jgi:hypothetical protein